MITLCACGCGHETTKALYSDKRRGIKCGQNNAFIRGHNFRSCRTHGLKHSAEYNAWGHMKSRCTNPNDSRYADYGGRGITVCMRWMKFENFIGDVGRRPTSQHSLDRFPNNDGNYEPGNVRWATRTQQTRNRRKFKMRVLKNFSDVEIRAEFVRRGLEN